jgi:hypothetical protein
VTLRANGTISDAGLTVQNASGQIAYVLCGPGTVSSTLHTVALANGAYWEAPYQFGGQITCVLAASTGNVMATRFA